MDLLTVREVLALSARYLAQRGSESARLDAELLTAHVLGVRRIDLYLSPERPLNEQDRTRLREAVRRRGLGEPVAYITGHREFYGIPIEVAPGALVPRPETEVLVDAVLERIRAVASPRVVDIGTGSGAIACAVVANHSTAQVVATDRSRAALNVAALNVRRYAPDGRIVLLEMDVLSGLARRAFADVIVSNPPYVGESEAHLLDRGVREFEPPEALFCEEMGRAVTRRIIEQAPDRLKPGGALILEVGTPAHREFVQQALAPAGFCALRALKDPAGVVRGFSAQKA